MTNEEFLKSIIVEGEEWKDVVGYEGYYMVSTFGRVISLGRYVVNSIKSNRWVKPKLLSLNKHTTKHRKNPYHRYMVHLNKHRHRKAITLHRVVATAFIENPNNYPCIDHIDGDPLNNKASNLRWCTHIMNMNNPVTTERISVSKKGKYNTCKSKPVVQLDSNDNVIKIYPSACESHREGFNQGSVSACCRGKLKHHHGFKWMFMSDYENLVNKSKNS